MRNKITTALLVALAVGTLAGCSGTSDKAATETSQPKKVAAASTATATEGVSVIEPTKELTDLEKPFRDDVVKLVTDLRAKGTVGQEDLTAMVTAQFAAAVSTPTAVMVNSTINIMVDLEGGHCMVSFDLAGDKIDLSNLNCMATMEMSK